MPGIFKKLNASDVKITPFEAHKQYNTTNLASIGAQTASLHWSGLNKETFTEAQNRYYQIDKLYYRNYIQERAHRIELDDATYTTQERRLYQSASIVSLSQKTFGSEVQPNTFNLSIIAHGVTSSFADDGFGNIYDTSTNLDKADFPNEDNRVFYLSPVNSFKRADLNLDIETGNTYVSTPYPNGFSGNFSDNSYFVNPIRYNNIAARKLNLDKFTEAEVADMFGLTPNYELLPWKKGFKDGMIKGVVVGAAGLSINQSIRKAADAPASPISIGKPETSFSRSVEEGFYMGHSDLAKHFSKKTGVPVEVLLSFTKYKDQKATYNGIFNPETGETVMEAKIRFTIKFLQKYPQFREHLINSGIGGVSRSTYGSVEFIMNIIESAIPLSKKEIQLIRYKYLVDKKQKSKNINLTKEEQAIENKKLDNLKEYFMAIEEFIKETPEAAALFISFY